MKQTKSSFKSFKSSNLFLRQLVLFCLLLLTFNPLSAQNFSGLKDKELVEIDDLGSAITSLFSALKGSIQKVVVTHDAENLLKINIYYTEYQTAYLYVKSLNKDKKEQADVQGAEISLESLTSPIEMSLPLKSNVPEGTKFESPFLEIKVTKTKNDFVGKTFIFSLNKKWQTDINPENIVLTALLEPVGSASNLKENDQQIILPKRIPEFKAYYLKDVSSVRNLRLNTNTSAIKQPISSTTTTTASIIDGTWINEDNNTRGITKLIISNSGKSIRVYGKCSPQDCDWGLQNLSTQGTNRYSAVYDQSFAVSNLYLTLTENTLAARHDRKYKQDNRTNTTNESFKKQTLTLMITQPMVINTAVLKDLSLKKDEVDKGAQGPDNKPISLWEDLVTDVDFEFPDEITNVRLDIYPDKNPASGIFYYLPSAYYIKWDKENGYKFKMLYGTGTSEGEAGDVRMAGTFTPGISTKEVDFIKGLLDSYIKRNPGTTFSKLRLIPLKETPTVSFGAELQGQYNIPPEKVNVAISSSITNPIDVSWVTDNLTKEEMQVALVENVGIQGTMKFKPEGDLVPEQQIPIRITLADPHTLGRFIFEPLKWRSEKWKNNTPYPLKLKYIHALMVKEEGNKSIPLIYSWNLNELEIPSMSQVSFNTSKMPKWIDTHNDVERIWLEYSVAQCEPCDKKVLNDLTGGTAGSTVKNVTFEAFQVLETTGASFLQVKVRSLQCDPKREKLVELDAIRIDKDMAVFSTGPFYLAEGDEIQFEYYFTLVMPDGKFYRSDDWKSSNELEMFIGLHTLKEAISTLPEDTPE